jgi:prefoldin beta subunit
MSDEKLQLLQMQEQRLQQVLMQKQALQAQLMETDAALGEVRKVAEAYKIVGNIMVLSSRDVLEKDLLERKESIELRLASMAKQENSMREEASTLQKEIMGAMKNDGKHSR